MARNSGAASNGEQAGGRTVVYSNNVLKQLGSGALARMAPHTVPWISGACLVPVGYGTHAMWGDPSALPWATAGMAVSGVALSCLTYAVSRYRKTLGRIQSTGTTAAASAWLLAATVTGPTARPVLDLGIWVGSTLALGWNIRNIIRPFEANEPGGQSAVQVSGPSLFKQLLMEKAAQAGREIGGVKQIEQGPASISGKVELLGGDTAEDLQRAAGTMESLAGLPRGSIQVTEDPRNAGEANASISNPMVLDDPIPWPGPSRPGGSPLEPLHVGMFQDGKPAEIVIPGGHAQVMGMTGAAKTTAGAWGVWGEWITRRQTALVVIDITKQGQSTEPAKNAVHYVVDSPAKAKAFMGRLRRVAQERLAHMAKLGKIAWDEDTGLSYLLVWIEEAADFFRHVDMDEFIDFARMLRSAGGSFVWSLQRADHTQMPTIVKGQGGGKICFGVESTHDAGWGLTDRQDDLDAKPEQWKASKPGMAYIDMKGVGPEHVAMPMRWHDWGTDDTARVRNFAAHCALYPASERPVDKITAKLFESLPSSAEAARAEEAADDLPVEGVAREYVTPDSELDGTDATRPPVDPEAELEEVEDVPLGGGRKMNPAEARAFLDQAIAAFADGRPFRPRDLKHVLAATGMGRTWAQNQLRLKVDAGELEHDEAEGCYRAPVLQPA